MVYNVIAWWPLMAALNGEEYVSWLGAVVKCLWVVFFSALLRELELSLG
jgi:hypothetical protein